MGIKAIKFLNLTSIIFLFISFFTFSYGQKNLEGLEKTTSEHVTSTYLNTNNISTIIYNDGRCDVIGGNSGFEFPIGSGKHAIYQSGLLWGALVEGDSIPKVGGSEYRTVLEPGKILADGTPDDPSLPKNRIYRVRPDVYSGGPYTNLSQEMKDEKDSYENIRNLYEADWNEWPAADGAPYVDKDLNGIYDPAIDLPGVKNAAQTIWYVANDLEALDSNYFSPEAYKLGIELQVTIWAYQIEPIFSNSLFRKYKLINKSLNEFRDMYISQWNDPDLGNAGDDFVGTDTLRNMIYVYNSTDNDYDYGSAIPSAGFQLLQGPIVAGNAGEDRNKNGIDDASDFAIFENSLRGPGFINLPMTSSYHPLKTYHPYLGDPDESIDWYKLFQGIDLKTGEFYIDPNTGETTIYPLSGDPVTQTGWVDGQVFPAGDKRMGFSSGPFNLAAGDTQEVVIAALAEMGSDRLESISLLRYYADEIQNMYKSLNFPGKLPAPQSPAVKTKITVDGILLDWSSNKDLVAEIENFNSEGYKFQGYNVFRGKFSESGLAFNSKAAVFDIIDGVTTIYGEFRDSITGLPTQGIKQQGTDSGIERSIFFDKDNEFDSPLIKGKEYVFGVNAYTYNENPTNGISTTETPIHYFKVTYLDTLPGANFGDQIEFAHYSGNGDGEEIDIQVVDPSKLTGDDYEIFFTKIDYFRDVDGEWYPFAKVGDLTGSRLEARATYGDTANTIDIEFELLNNSPNNAWIDGIIISFPAGTNIISVPEFQAGGGTLIPQINGSHIVLGLVNNQRTQDGIFHGDEKWNVIIQNTELPINLEYILKDDGWENNQVDIIDSLFISEIGFASKTEKYWNLRNITKNDTVLFNQTIMDGVDIYTNEVLSNPIADGIQINLKTTYEMPTTFSKIILDRWEIQRNESSEFDRFQIDDFTQFGVKDARAINSNLEAGTSDSSLLIKDYQIRFNGTLRTDMINGKLVQHIVTGGQIATIYGASRYDLADHPLNPNPGVSEPFTIRIPFEVWCIDDNKQINLMVYDRLGDPASSDTFQVWNKDGRMYTEFVMSDYHENVIDPEGEEVQNYATWNLVWWRSDWMWWAFIPSGDVLKFIYHNPVSPNDKFTFTAPQRFNKEDFRIPESFELYHNFPNPFNPTTTIRFDLPEDNNVKLEVFNILGQRVRTLVNDFYKGGIHEVQFNSRGLASGVYIYRLEAGSHINVKKMVLLK
jgi:hypothetical protein